mgnify:CR=1 FL=1
MEMHKDLINRILNSVEVIAYFIALFSFLMEVIRDDGFVTFVVFIVLTRVCVNYILQAKLFDLAAIIVVKKLFKK